MHAIGTDTSPDTLPEAAPDGVARAALVERPIMPPPPVADARDGVGEPEQVPATPARPTRSWRSTFFTGLLLWILSVVVTALTQNLNMIPTVVLLGSFLVPATAVIWYLDHYHSEIVTPALAARAFIVGGTIGVIAASVLEALLLGGGLLLFLGVGLIEEFVKLLGLVLVARGLQRYTVRDGIVLGAAVGFGFAALESSGYAFNALFVREGHTVALSLGSLVSTELFRGILAPLGHGLWTAYLGGALFAASEHGRLRMGWNVLGSYLLVAVLHGLWDAMGLIASLMTALYLATSAGGLDLWFGGALPPEDAQVVTYFGFYFGGLVVLSLIGIGLLRRRWQRGDGPRVSPAASPTPAPAT
jgi:RsiW-degrading membrane proteinase PrsW (M82 family)